MKKRTVELKTYKVYLTNKYNGNLIPFFSLRSVSEDIAFERIYMIIENHINTGLIYNRFENLLVYAGNLLIYKDNLVEYLRKYALI